MNEFVSDEIATAETNFVRVFSPLNKTDGAAWLVPNGWCLPDMIIDMT
jgi:hypothetical protein